MHEQIAKRFRGEVEKMGYTASRRYRGIVADELLRKILRTLSIAEHKELYKWVLDHEHASRNRLPWYKKLFYKLTRR